MPIDPCTGRLRRGPPLGSRRYHLPTITAIGAAASRNWFFQQPPETRAFIINRLLVAKVRDYAARRGHPQPIIYEREIDARDDGTLIVDTSKVKDAVNPDPALYRAMLGGGYTDRAREEEWLNGSPAMQAFRAQQDARRSRRKARREARRAAEAAQREPIDITPPKKPDGKG
jgi:hypothetical protein